ncbi:galactosyl transferase GMA12/MNN10 family protein [Penicillium malachiteum]|uniref:galactosyl transferase GMA12/MNN10 family protein n=1 Tax=Penicillium malachiteum TaxID=1324776 RepID=UPI002546D8DF|nr:galactosyl transferase GMA12/MNN10 family protein [Penicillium malachiteum]KAJ5729278.1 galactosyl transferase GMA12/MNN10 family protein [Penicillium malachiteum]
MIYGGRSIYEKARRNNHPLTILRDPIIDKRWNKYLILMTKIVEELEKPEGQRLQWLFWFDSDTVLMNLNLPLETFLPPSNLPHVHLLLTQDMNGINNGNFFIRVHPWSFELLNSALAYPRLYPKANFQFGEQSALSHVLTESEYFARSTVYCPSRGRRMGNYPRRRIYPRVWWVVHPGDLLVHFPGTPVEKLDDAMEPYIAISEEQRPEWNVPLKETGLIKKTTSFWERYSLLYSEDTTILFAEEDEDEYE